VHYTDKGAEFVAKRVFEAVEAASVLGPSAPKATADAGRGARLNPATRNGGRLAFAADAGQGESSGIITYARGPSSARLDSH
jgi:hypothetical protein